jgi:transposase
MEKADQQQQAGIDPCAVQAALEKLKQHPEPEVGFMLMGVTSRNGTPRTLRRSQFN